MKPFATVATVSHRLNYASPRAAAGASLLVAIFLLPFVLYTPFFAAPIMDDEAFFMITARRMIEGRILYRDIFDLKPPLIFGWYALTGFVFGWHTWSPHVMVLLVFSATCASIYIEARLLFNRWAAYGAALAFSLLTGVQEVGVWADPDAFVLLPMVGALVAFTQGRRSGAKRWYLILQPQIGAALIGTQRRRR